MMNDESIPIPRDFFCPITREIMQNPVVLIEDVSIINSRMKSYTKQFHIRFLGSFI